MIVDDYRHRTGEHCASTALRNILAHHGTQLSEAMIFGLASGLGFLYVCAEGMSPSRMFHGRTATLETDFGLNTGVPLVDRIEPSDAVAWKTLRDSIDRGQPVMVSDTNTLSCAARLAAPTQGSTGQGTPARDCGPPIVRPPLIP